MATILGPQVPGSAFQSPPYAYHGQINASGYLPEPYPAPPHTYPPPQRWLPNYPHPPTPYAAPHLSGLQHRLPVPYYHTQVFPPTPSSAPYYPGHQVLPFSLHYPHWPFQGSSPSPDGHRGGTCFNKPRSPDGAPARRRVSRRTKSDMSRGGWGSRGGAQRADGRDAIGGLAGDGHHRRNSWDSGGDGRRSRNGSRNGGRGCGTRSPCNTRNGDGRLQRTNRQHSKQQTSIRGGVTTPALPFTSKRPSEPRLRRSVTPDEDITCSKALSAYSEVADGALELRPARGALGRGRAGRAVAQPHCLRMALASAQGGLDKGYMPELTGNGTGGAYFIRAKTGDPIAVFKPRDEEPRASNNPRGLAAAAEAGKGLKKGVRPGEGAGREVAAYLLDHGHFAGVPPTQLVVCRSKNKVTQESRLGKTGEGGISKVGSLQKFILSDADCEEMGPAAFSKSQVHKICVLDMRLANADRNGSNILACRMEDGWELTPIDHGYCLPDTLEDLCFEWKYWKQAKEPFDEAALKYIAKLDAKEDIRTLEQHGISLREGCRRVFRTCNSLLKKAAARGLNPHEIASIMCREAFEPSPLERLFNAALGSFKGEAVDEDVLISAVDKRIDRYLDGLDRRRRR
ncbi:unnamed protein product [Ostreobium quekettii]|uniref:1-phosphatidylinositol 4-kinase n=1 Tax=Ostreobium quekettii TaxID=121088 RepID=A0A8S1JBF9_9CHLO|nr:unnamed protein product [Ostreobium quekettii]|eukprot:evm.model.scf_2736.1 EVM.evm.TU.scf_2736.1   scf_2736:6686-10212(-)